MQIQSNYKKKTNSFDIETNNQSDPTAFRTYKIREFVDGYSQYIYFVEYKSQADLKVFFVDYKSQAGWRSKEKKHLLY